MIRFPQQVQVGSWWLDQIIWGDSREVLRAMPPESVHLAITSPPYNVGLDYDQHHDNLRYEEYLEWLRPFWEGICRVLVPGGRFALNICPTSIRDFKPLHHDTARQLRDLGLIMRTEIIWYKQAMRRRTAWGSFCLPSNPHIVPSWEYVMVFSKGQWELPGNKSDADIRPEEFIEFSDGFWAIPPETRGRLPFLKSRYAVRRKGRDRPELREVQARQAQMRRDAHPAPFPERLIYRLIKFYSYRGNVVLDPFGGTGTVAVVARQTGRHYVHIDVSEQYCRYAERRVASVAMSPANGQAARPAAAKRRSG